MVAIVYANPNGLKTKWRPRCTLIQMVWKQNGGYSVRLSRQLKSRKQIMATMYANPDGLKTEFWQLCCVVYSIRDSLKTKWWLPRTLIQIPDKFRQYRMVWMFSAHIPVYCTILSAGCRHVKELLKGTVHSSNMWEKLLANGSLMTKSRL